MEVRSARYSNKEQIMPILRFGAPALLTCALLLSCADQPAPTEVAAPAAFSQVLGSSRDPGGGMVDVPFHATFYTVQESFIENDCGPGVGLMTQIGEGKGTHLGRLTTRMVFCYDLNPGPTFGVYWFIPGPQNGYFEAADGDRIFITVLAGQVFFDPSLGPDYVAYWKDPFLITGGTGRFAGATGGGWLDSKFRSDYVFSDHDWRGVLTMMPGH